MRNPLAIAAAGVLLAACSSSNAVANPPSPAPSPVPATVAALEPYFGSYATGDGDTIVIARLGWFYDVRTSAYRTIYATSKPDAFTIGAEFAVPLPKFADLRFQGDKLTAGTVTATKVAQKTTDVSIPANGATLAGTITEAPGPGTHPGIVIVHGAERGQRHFYDIWVGTYTSLGLTVLTYDKRGIGSSTGTFPGDFPTPAALAVYAEDASAALKFLAAWPGVDPKHVGFHGGSQGGWTVPLAIQRHDGASFAVLASAPATTVDQTDEWAGFTNGGVSAPTESDDQMLSEVRTTHSGYDPAPALRALEVPALWLLGTNDRTVPTALCVEILDSMHKPNFTVQTLPAGHALLVNPTGLLADDNRSPGLAPQLVPALKTFLAAAA